MDTENLPALWARLAVLEGQYRYNLAVMGKDNTRADSVISQENIDIKAEMDELRYALRTLNALHTQTQAAPAYGNGSRIPITWYTFIALALLNAGFMLVMLYLLLWQR